MVNNSMRLSGITKKVSQTADGQQVDQITQVQIGPETRVLTQTRLSELSATPTVIVTQTIGTPTTDYTRYVSVDTKQTKPNGQPLDFTNVLGVWGSSTAGTISTSTSGQLYNETILGVIPFGNLNQTKRHKLQQLIRKQNVYEVDYKNVARSLESGRPTYTYQVTVDAQAYVTLLKQFGNAVGLNHMADLNPADYATSERLPFTVAVDVWSREVKRIVYGDGGRTEEYSGYNAVKPIEIPKTVVTVQELQSRLQSLQQ